MADTSQESNTLKKRATVSPIPIAAADIVTSAPSNAAVTLWDQPSGIGHSITFTGTGSVNLANYSRDPANPGLGTWDHAVRKLQGQRHHWIPPQDNRPSPQRTIWS